MFTLLPIKAVYFIHTQSDKLYSKYLQNFCHYKISCCLCALLKKTNKQKNITTNRNSMPSKPNNTHTYFCIYRWKHGLLHFTTGVTFQTDVRNDTKSPH